MHRGPTHKRIGLFFPLSFWFSFLDTDPSSGRLCFPPAKSIVCGQAFRVYQSPLSLNPMFPLFKILVVSSSTAGSSVGLFNCRTHNNATETIPLRRPLCLVLRYFVLSHGKGFYREYSLSRWYAPIISTTSP